MLSTYPADRITLECERCGIVARYDRAACLRAGGDRRLVDFREQVRRRKGCRGKVEHSNPTLSAACDLLFRELRR